MDLKKLIHNSCKIYESDSGTVVYRRGSKIYKVIKSSDFVVTESHIHGLRLPHVVPLNKIEYIDGHVVLEFPYHPYTLREYMKSHPYISPEQRIILVKDVATALTALHFAGYFHCELSLDNILVKDGRAYLTDFSQVIRMTSIDNISKEDISSFYYRAPEYHYHLNKKRSVREGLPYLKRIKPDAVFNNPYDKSRADSWAFGILAYVILGGFLDFDRRPEEYLNSYLESPNPFNHLLIRVCARSEEMHFMVKHLYRNHLNFSQKARCVSPIHLADLNKLELKCNKVTIPEAFHTDEGKIHWILYSKYVDEIMTKLGATIRAKIKALELSYFYWEEPIWESITLYAVYWICVGLDLESDGHIRVESIVKESKNKCAEIGFNSSDIDDLTDVALFAEELTCYLNGTYIPTTLLNFVNSKKIVYEAVKKGYHDYGKLILSL